MFLDLWDVEADDLLPVVEAIVKRDDVIVVGDAHDGITFALVLGSNLPMTKKDRSELAQVIEGFIRERMPVAVEA